jgi:hypothetical protein
MASLFLLREPQSRLHSLYRDLARYPSQPANRRLHKLTAACFGLSPQQLAHSSDPVIRSHADNYVVRQLAGCVRNYPVGAGDWQGLLESPQKSRVPGFHRVAYSRRRVDV